MLKYKNVPHNAIKLMLFSFSLEGAARTWLEKEPPHSIHTWEDLVSKFVNYFFPPSKTTNLKNNIKNFQQRFDETFSEAWDHFKDLLAASENLLNRTPRDALTIIENKSKVRTSRNKPVATQQATVKVIEETCVTCGGPHPYYECLATSGNTFYACEAVGPYNQGGNGYQPQGDPNYHASNQMGLPGFPPSNVKNSQNYNQNRGAAYEGPSILPTSSSPPKEVEREPEVTKDKKLSLPKLTPTRMTLELANPSVAYPVSVAEYVFVKVGKFYVPADFVVVDYDVDPRVPLILRRPFLRTARALIDVHDEELTLRVNNEAITFKVGHTSRYSRGDFIFEEIETFLRTPNELSNLDNDYYDTEGDILYPEKLLNEDPSLNLLPIKNENLKQADVIMTKPSMEEPPKLELKDLPSLLEYAFLEGTNKLPVNFQRDKR
nr:reverse transcriptase domain-containing protein [Tanacetum cinerariifolium]